MPLPLRARIARKFPAFLVAPLHVAASDHGLAAVLDCDVLMDNR